MLNIELIEDDVGMRSLFAEWLEGLGYRLHARADIGSAPTPGIDLVMLGLPVDAAQKAQVLARVEALYPGVRVIGTSTQLSRTLDGGSQQARALGVAHLVAKPCARHELAAAVAATIGPAH